MKADKLLFISYWFPLGFFLLFGSFMRMSILNSATLEHLLLSTILGGASLLLGQNKWIRLGHLLLSGVLLSFLFLSELSIYHLYQSSIDTPTIYILLESNFHETKEFVRAYSDAFFWIMSACFILVLIVQVVLWKQTKLISIPIKSKKGIGVLVLLMVLALGNYAFRDKNFGFLVYRAYCDYQDQFHEESTQFGASTSSVFKGATSNSNDFTGVIIIGESSSRSHYSIYDYERNTSPELKSMAKDLMIYHDVISPHCHTRESLLEAFTLANSNDTPEKNGSIIQLANEIGFETFWLSNQVPIGYFETSVTRLAHAADEELFINRAHSNESTPLDEELLEHFERALNGKTPKKLIVVHLLGNHAIYSNRYPEEFEQFKERPTTLFRHQEAYQTINQYDNSIAYTDYVVASLIKLTQESTENGFALFFSDHGEDVYQTIDNFDHNDLKCTKPMCEIPFVLWASEKVKDRCSFVPSRKYMTDDLFHTIADLMDVNGGGVDDSKSIVSDSFNYKERIIPTGENYDP